MFSQCWLYTRVAQRSYYVFPMLVIYASSSKVILCFPNVELYTRIVANIGKTYYVFPMLAIYAYIAQHWENIL